MKVNNKNDKINEMMLKSKLDKLQRELEELKQELITITAEHKLIRLLKTKTGLGFEIRVVLASKDSIHIYTSSGRLLYVVTPRSISVKERCFRSNELLKILAEISVSFDVVAESLYESL